MRETGAEKESGRKREGWQSSKAEWPIQVEYISIEAIRSITY